MLQAILVKVGCQDISTSSRQLKYHFSMVECIEEIILSVSFLFVWLSNRQRNKQVHTQNGNRCQRGKGLECVYWNKGSSLLKNKLLDIESILGQHKPHILGLGEANVHHDHDLDELQFPNYTLHLDSCISNLSLGIARTAVYTHNSIRVTRRHDLEDDKIAAIWLECGLPQQKKV